MHTSPALDPRAFHKSLVVIDGHCDTVLDLVGASYGGQTAEARNFFKLGGSGHVDLPRLVAGGVTCQVLALYTDTKLVGQARDHTWKLLETIEGLWERSDRFRPVTRAEDIRKAKEEGWVASILSIEGAEAVGGPEDGSASGLEADRAIQELRAFYGRRTRLMGLTWSRRNACGRGVGSPGTDGLSPFGRRVVGEMERLGMIVDASHLSDEALDDLLAVAERPVVASHSNSRELCPNPRNLTDAQAEAIARTGGLVAATFAGKFIDPEPERATLARFVDHVEHLLSVIGPDHVGIGSDFDGWMPGAGAPIRDCADLPELTALLLDRGLPPDTVAKVMGGNWLRLIGEIVG